jgi:ribosomal protein S15P/S13E
MELTREGHEDNDKAKLVVAKFDTKTNDRDLKNVLGDNVVKMIEALKDHLEKSAKDLEANEIKASYEFAAY